MAMPRRRASAPRPAYSVSDQPEPKAKEQPPVAEQLDGRRILRQAERVVHRREDDAGAELDPRRRLRERRADHEERRHVPVVDEVVLGRPDGGEAEPLGLDGQPDRLVVGTRPVRLAGAKLRAEESEAQSHRPRRYQPMRRDVQRPAGQPMSTPATNGPIVSPATSRASRALVRRRPLTTTLRSRRPSTRCASSAPSNTGDGRALGRSPEPELRVPRPAAGRHAVLGRGHVLERELPDRAEP